MAHELYAKVLREVREILEEEIREKVGRTTYSVVWGEIGEIKETVRGIIQRAVKQEIVNDAAEKRREEWKGYIDRKVKALFDQDIQDLVKDEFKKILEKMKS